ncbi:hypothetical protein M405DRAFT_847004 [Rhizopogon salebrosus TDB-379]|nr:hypothetical protein M405DRAFT_847004 [Rhizopogon salebrosus TDB-379]
MSGCSQCLRGILHTAQLHMNGALDPLVLLLLDIYDQYINAQDRAATLLPCHSPITPLRTSPQHPDDSISHFLLYACPYGKIEYLRPGSGTLGSLDGGGGGIMRNKLRRDRQGYGSAATWPRFGRDLVKVGRDLPRVGRDLVNVNRDLPKSTATY